MLCLTALLVASSLLGAASAQVLPVNALFGFDGVAPPAFVSDVNSTIFFDITALTKTVRVTQIGVRLTCTLANNNPAPFEAFTIAGTSRGQENSFPVGWTPVSLVPVIVTTPASGIDATNAPDGALPGTPEGPLVDFFLFDVADFLVSAATGIAVIPPPTCQFKYNSVNTTGGPPFGNTVGGTTYTFIGIGTGFNNVNITVSSMVERSNVHRKRNTDISSFNNPNVILQIAPPLLLGLTCGATNPVVAGSGVNNAQLTGTLSNNDFVALGPLNVFQTLTLPPGVTLVSTSPGTTSAVTGCSWKVNVFPGNGVATVDGPTADTAIQNQAPNATVGGQPTPLLFQNLNFGNASDGQVTCTASSCPFPIPFADVGGVLEAQTSFFVPASFGTFNLGVFSQQGAFTPLAGGNAGAGGPVSNPNVFVYLQLVTNPASASSNFPNPPPLGFAPGVPNSLPEGFFAVTNGAPAPFAPGLYNIRVVVINANGANAASSFDFELYIGPAVAPTPTQLDSGFQLLQGSQNPGATFAFTPAVGSTPATFSYSDLCVGGSITFTTTVTVDSSTDVGCDTAQHLVLDPTSPSGALVTSSPCDTCVPVVHQYTMDISKTSLCDESLSEGWSVAMYQTNLSTLTNSLTPFDTFDALLAANTAPTVTGGPFDTINFNDPVTTQGAAGVTGAQCYPLDPSCLNTANDFFFRATGRIQISVPGIYTIATVENRGVRVTVDGTVAILNEPFLTGTFENFHSLTLSAGIHNVVVDHYDTLGISLVQVFLATGAEPVQNLTSPPFPSLRNGNTTQTYALMRTVPACQQPCADNLFSGYNVRMWQSNPQQLLNSTSPFETIDTFAANNVAPDAAQCGVQFINYLDANANSTQRNEFPNNILPYPLQFNSTTEISNFLFLATGKFFIGTSGVYTIVAETDRGVRVTIDGKVEIMDEPVADGYQDPIPYASLNLTAGVHTISVAHYSSVGNTTIGDAQIAIGIAPGNIRTGPGAGVVDVFSQLNFTLLGTALACQLAGTEHIAAGQNFTFTLTLHNEGPSDAEQLNVADLLKIGGSSGAQLIGIRTSGADSVAPSNTALATNTTVLEVPANSTRRIFFDVLVPSSAAVGSTVCNNASVTAGPGETLLNTNTNNVSVCDTVARIVDLEASQTQTSSVIPNVFGAPSHSIVAGAPGALGTETYTITVTNAGPSDTAGFTLPVTLNVPATSVIVANTTSVGGVACPTCTFTGSTLSVPGLAAGQTATLTVTVQAESNATAAANAASSTVGLPTLTAGETAYESYFDENPLAATCFDVVPTLTTAIIREYDLTVNKTQTLGTNPVIAGVGGSPNVGYTVTVTNNGPSDASNIELIDTLIANGVDILNGAAAQGITPGSFAESQGTFSPGAPLCSNPLFAGAGWNVRVFQSDNATTHNGTSPFEDLDAILASGRAPNATTTVPFINFIDIINKDGTSSPKIDNGAGVSFPFPENNTSDFYAEITGTINVFTPGFYTLGVRSNRGVRVAIDGETVILLEPKAFITFDSFYVAHLLNGTHTVEVSYFDTTGANNGGTSILQVLYAPQAIAKPYTNPPFTLANYNFLPTSGACLFLCNSPAGTAKWTVQMWPTNASVINGGPGFASPFESFDDFFAANPANLPAITDETQDVINYDARAPTSTNDFFLNPTAYPLASAATTPFFLDAETVFFVPQDGAYTIGTTSDLGVRVKVDGETVIIHDPVEGQNSGPAPTTTGDRINNFVNLQLARGAHDIEVTHYGLGGSNATLQVFITPLPSNLDINNEPTNNASFVLLAAAPLCELPVWSTGALAAGATATLTVNLTVDHSAAIGAIFNSVEFAQPTAPLEFVIDTNVDGNEDSVLTPIGRNVNISLAKVQTTPGGNAAVIAGSGDGNLVYTVTVHNFGPSDTSGVDVRDLLALPGSGQIEGLVFSPAVDTSSGNNIWHTGPIAVGDSAVLTVNATVDCGAECASGNNTIINTASVNGLTDARETFIDSPVASVGVNTTVNRTADVTVDVSHFGSATITAAGTNENDGDDSGACRTFRVGLRNNGPSALSAANVLATLTLPHGVAVVHVGGGETVAINGNKITLGFGSLDCGCVADDDDGDACSAKAFIKVCADSSTAIGTNTIVNSVAFVNGGCENIINTGDDTASDSLSVTRSVGLLVTKTADAASTTAGQSTGNVGFTIVVTNTGPSDASNVAVADVLSGTTASHASLFQVTPGTTTTGWNVNTFVNTASPNTGTLGAAATLATGTPFSSETYQTLDLSDFSVVDDLGISDFAVRANTQIFLTQTGLANYTFAVKASDGAQLSIDGVPLITIDGLHSTPQTTFATKALLPGAHVVSVLYFNHNGTLDLHVHMVPGATSFTLAAGNLLSGAVINSYSPANSVNGTFTIPVLRPHQPVTLHVSYTADQFANGDVTDTATVTAAEAVGSTTDDGTTTVTRECNLNSLSLAATSNVATVVAGAGQQVVHTITLINSGPSHCDDVLVHYRSSFDTGPHNRHHGITSNASTVDQTKLLSVDSGSSVSFTVVYNVPSKAHAGDKVTTFARLDDANFSPGLDRKRAPVGTEVHVTTTVTREVQLSITKTADADLIHSGSHVTYTITVTNHGPSDTNHLSVTDVCTLVSGATATGCPATSFSSPFPNELAAGASVNRTVSVTGGSAGVNVFSDVATASGKNTAQEHTNVATSATVETSVGTLKPTLTFSAFRTRNSFEDSSSSDDDDSEHCTTHEHSAERCTRLFFVELFNADANVRADNISVTVSVTNVALAEALLTQSSRENTVTNNGHGLFTWTIPTLQPGARARIALKVRVTHSTQQVTAHVDSADTCLPQSTQAVCASFQVGAGDIAALHTLNKVF